MGKIKHALTTKGVDAAREMCTEDDIKGLPEGRELNLICAIWLIGMPEERDYHQDGKPPEMWQAYRESWGWREDWDKGLFTLKPVRFSTDWDHAGVLMEFMPPSNFPARTAALHAPTVEPDNNAGEWIMGWHDYELQVSAETGPLAISRIAALMWLKGIESTTSKLEPV